MDVNIRGVLHGIAAVLPTMQSQGSGHVINQPADVDTTDIVVRPLAGPA